MQVCVNTGLISLRISVGPWIFFRRRSVWPASQNRKINFHRVAGSSADLAFFTFVVVLPGCMFIKVPWPGRHLESCWKETCVFGQTPLKLWGPRGGGRCSVVFFWKAVAGREVSIRKGDQAGVRTGKQSVTRFLAGTARYSSEWPS